MVADDDHGAIGGEIFFALDDDKADTRSVTHNEVEGAGDGVLGEAVLADDAKGEGGEDAIGGAEEEGGVGGEEAGEKAEEWDGGEEV